RAGIIGAGAVVPPIAVPGEAAPAAASSAAPALSPAAAAEASYAAEPLEALTSIEAEVLEAAVARLIPTDENGPGAREARAARYIDRALAGFLAPSRDAYAKGLAALDTFARSSKGGPFATLTSGAQDEVLT